MFGFVGLDATLLFPDRAFFGECCVLTLAVGAFRTGSAVFFLMVCISASGAHSFFMTVCLTVAESLTFETA